MGPRSLCLVMLALGLVAAPAVAGAASCPVCDEYTLDIRAPKEGKDRTGPGEGLGEGGQDGGDTASQDTGGVSVRETRAQSTAGADAAGKSGAEEGSDRDGKQQTRGAPDEGQEASTGAESPNLRAVGAPRTTPLSFEERGAGAALVDRLGDGTTLGLIGALVAIGLVAQHRRRTGSA